jgi:hypothetical protein
MPGLCLAVSGKDTCHGSGTGERPIDVGTVIVYPDDSRTQALAPVRQERCKRDITRFAPGEGQSADIDEGRFSLVNRTVEKSSQSRYCGLTEFHADGPTGPLDECHSHLVWNPIESRGLRSPRATGEVIELAITTAVHPAR